jgi:hypothetical protein
LLRSPNSRYGRLEDIRADGEASVAYAVGDSPIVARRRSRHKGTVSGDTLTIAATFTNFTANKLTAADMLLATFQGQGRSQASMSKIELAALTRPGAIIKWTPGEVERGQMVSSAELIIDGVPIPDDANVSAATPSASETQKRLLGAWVGAWGGSLRHILIVEDIRADGEASVVYAVGDSPIVARRWSRHKGTVSGDTLTIVATKPRTS